VMKEKLQPAQNSVGTASNQFANMRRTEKPVLMNVPDDFEVIVQSD
jgi:hypothetical protein